MTGTISGEPNEGTLLFSIIMPAYNEQDVIGATLTALTDYLDASGFRYEIIVVNDGSEDRTEDVLREVEAIRSRVRHINNHGPGGYGHAIRKGLEVYEGDAVVVVTADGSDSPKNVGDYFRKISEGYDCVFGSRFAPGAKVRGYPPVKLLANRIANQVIALLVGHAYKDFTNGFKCYRRYVVDDMQPLIGGQFNITIEMAVKAVTGGWKYAVVPTDWTQRSAGISSFRLLRLAKPYALTLLYCLIRNYLRNVAR